MEIPAFLIWFDSYLIRLYRLTGYAYADFFLGTLALAFLAIIIGEASIYIASMAIRKQVQGTSAEARKYQDLSLEALKAGDKEAYTAANKLANDAFGKSFFQQLALSAGFFWPVGLALAWMEYRFAEVEFPIPATGYSLGPVGVFILLYVAAYLLFKRVKKRWSFSRGILGIKEQHGSEPGPKGSLTQLSLPGDNLEKTRIDG